MPRVGIGTSGWQVDCLGKRQKVRYVTVDEVHLLGDVVPTQLFIKFEKASSLEGLAVLIKRLLPGLQETWRVRWKAEVQLAALANALQGPKNENPVVQNR